MISLGRGTLNLRNLGTYDPVNEEGDEIGSWSPEIMTIEFRQHAGSLDFAEIHAWMDFVPDHGSIELLNALGCSPDTKRFYLHRLAGQSQGRNEGVFAADIAEIDLFPVDAMIAPLLEYTEWKRRQDHHPGSARDRIREKFRMGGYGKFSDEYLNQLVDFNLYDPHFGLRDKLSIDRESYSHR